MDERVLNRLTAFLGCVPAIDPEMEKGFYEDGRWWIKFRIDINHSLAWQVIQEIGSVANSLSDTQRLPCAFYPVSPAPYLSGGPKKSLSWVIENSNSDFPPFQMLKWLEGRLPNPVDDLSRWGKF